MTDSSIGVDAGNTLTFNGGFAGAGDLTKVGAGTLVLDNKIGSGTGAPQDSNNLGGQVNVNNGILSISTINDLPQAIVFPVLVNDNALQTLTFNGAPTGGTFALFYNGVSSGPVLIVLTSAHCRPIFTQPWPRFRLSPLSVAP